MYTAFDALSYLMDSTGGGAQDQENRVLRQALFSAYRDLVSVRDWRWYQAEEQIDICGQNSLSRHTLPWGVTSIDAFMLPQTGIIAEYLRPTEWARLIHSQFRGFTRIAWTILPSTSVADRYDLCVYNGWATDECVTVTYRRRPKDLRFTGWEPQTRTGTISWTDRDVEGSGTTFTNLMIGSVLRVSADPSKHPESLTGMNAYSDEGLIYGLANQNKLYAFSPAGKMTYPAGTKFVITDYLDISPGMYTALLSGAEVWMSRLMGKNIEGAAGIYGRDLRMAFESDAMAPLSGMRDYGGTGGGGGYYALWYLRPGCDQGVSYLQTGGECANGTYPIPCNVFGGTSADETAVTIHHHLHTDDKGRGTP
jgi:hypothetical protein